MKLGLFYGGISGEHEVSRISAASIYQHLDRSRYEVIPVGLSLDGGWFLQDSWEMDFIAKEGKLPLVLNETRRISVLPGIGLQIGNQPFNLDMAFLINHGIGGEDGRIQGLLDLVGLAYTGAGVLGSAVGMDKAIVKNLWLHHELPVVPFLLGQRHLWKKEKAYGLNLFETAVRQWGLPLFVKPANSGSSVGVSRVNDQENFEKALETAFAVDRKVLIEPAIDAREIEVAVLGSFPPKAFVPGEIRPTHGFYDYEAKYLDPQGAHLMIPADLNETQTQEIQTLAVEAFLAAECRGFARVDFFFDRKTGKLVLNEINTLPGFTTISMFPRMCMAGGLTYSQVLDAIINDAREFTGS